MDEEMRSKIYMLPRIIEAMVEKGTLRVLDLHYDVEKSDGEIVFRLRDRKHNEETQYRILMKIDGVYNIEGDNLFTRDAMADETTTQTEEKKDEAAPATEQPQQTTEQAEAKPAEEAPKQEGEAAPAQPAGAGA